MRGYATDARWGRFSALPISGAPIRCGRCGAPFPHPTLKIQHLERHHGAITKGVRTHHETLWDWVIP